MVYRKTLLWAAVFSLIAWGKAGAEVYDVRKFGAAGDKQTKDTAAIQAAIDACNHGGGGVVCFPAGDYLAGTIRLRSNVCLQLDPGATVRSSREAADYEKSNRCLIVGRDLENVAITGGGTLHGIGQSDYGRSGSKEPAPAFRAGVIRLDDCKDVTLRGIRILFSDTWTVHLRQCENVLIDGITIRNNYFRTNSDGIDPVSCRNVRISNCHIRAGDDCIVLKSTAEQACENVVVTNCTLESIATALKLGTESPGDFRNVHFSNCSIRNSTVGLGLYLKDGATMEQITFSHINIETPAPIAAAGDKRNVYPIFIDIEKRHPDSKIGKIRDVVFEAIQIRSGTGVLIQGMPESPIENLTLRDVTLRVCGPSDYATRRKHIGGRRSTSDIRDTLYARKPAYVTLAHVNGLTVDNLRVLMSEEDLAKYDRAALSADEVDGCVIRNVVRRPAGVGGALPIVALHDCRNALVSDCPAEPGTPCVLGLSGKRTANVSVNTTGMRAAARGVAAGDDVPADAVRSR